MYVNLFGVLNAYSDEKQPLHACMFVISTLEASETQQN